MAWNLLTIATWMRELFYRAVKTTLRAYYKNPNFVFTYYSVWVVGTLLSVIILSALFPVGYALAAVLLLELPYLAIVATAMQCHRKKHISEYFRARSDRFESWSNT
jgi:ABC-type transport system involved in cytochrome bd biosynthesis fused ATPase/permease subunit